MKHTAYLLVFVVVSSVTQASEFALKADSNIDDSWPTGYRATVTLGNTTKNPTSSWRAIFTLPKGHAVTSVWDGVFSPEDGAKSNRVTVSNPSWAGAGVIPSAGGAPTTFGMIISMPSGSAPEIKNLSAVANSTVTPPKLPIVAPKVPVLAPMPAPVAPAPSPAPVAAKTPSLPSASKSSPSKSSSLLPKPLIDGYWESWNSVPLDAIVGMNVDVINISFANFATTGSHTYVVSGVEGGEANLRQLIAMAHKAGKKVKVSIGGATFPLAKQLQTLQDAVGMAQALAAYVAEYKLDGVDLDIEDSPEGRLQVALLNNIRQLLPDKLITYTPKAPAATTSPYDQVIKDGHQYVDYISIMAYDYGPGYTYQADVQALIKMGVPASKIVVGLMPGPDDVGVMTTLADITAAANYVKKHNLAGIMFWDLNRDYQNITGLGRSAATDTARKVFGKVG